MTTFGDQLYQYGGVPVTVAPTPYSMYRNAIFVDMALGADGNDGYGIDRAKVTIQAGIDAATSGDMIVVLPGRHIISSGLATGLYNVGNKDITLIGGGNAWGDQVTISSSGVAAVPGLNVRSPGWRISGFRWVYATGTYGGGPTPAIHLPGAPATTGTAITYYVTIDNNYFYYCAAGIVSSGGAYGIHIMNNYFMVCTGACISVVDHGYLVPHQWKIMHNHFGQSITAGSSGTHIDGPFSETLIAHNYFSKSCLVCITNLHGNRTIVTKNTFAQNYVQASGHFIAGTSDCWVGNFAPGASATGTCTTGMSPAGITTAAAT